jgi:hypothetical protein
MEGFALLEVTIQMVELEFIDSFIQQCSLVSFVVINNLQNLLGFHSFLFLELSNFLLPKLQNNLFEQLLLRNAIADTIQISQKMPFRNIHHFEITHIFKPSLDIVFLLVGPPIFNDLQTSSLLLCFISSYQRFIVSLLLGID